MIWCIPVNVLISILYLWTFLNFIFHSYTTLMEPPWTLFSMVTRFWCTLPKLYFPWLHYSDDTFLNVIFPGYTTLMIRSWTLFSLVTLLWILNTWINSTRFNCWKYTRRVRTKKEFNFFIHIIYRVTQKEKTLNADLSLFTNRVTNIAWDCKDDPKL